MLRTKTAGDTGTIDVKAVQDALTKINDEVKRAADKADKAHGDLSVSVKADVDKLLTEQAELRGKLSEVEQLVARANRQTEGEQSHKSIGQQVVESDAVKAFASKVVGGQRVTVAVKTANVTSDLPSRVIAPERIASLPRLRRALFVRDIIAQGRTGSNAVEYVRTTGFTNNAEMVTEGTQKPRSTLSYDLVSTTVKTIAHTYKASKQILDDFAQLSSDIDNELRYGLKLKEEVEILSGGGTGADLYGIIPQATAFSAAFSPSSETDIDLLRLAILQAELALLPASAIVMHPTNWAKIELVKTSYGEYIFANPSSLAVPGMWGLPVVATQAMTPGKFLTGGFDSAATVLDREDMNVQIATQNEDDFVKNMITIRCEERLALVVKRPAAFIYGDFLA